MKNDYLPLLLQVLLTRSFFLNDNNFAFLRITSLDSDRGGGAAGLCASKNCGTGFLDIIASIAVMRTVQIIRSFKYLTARI